MNLKQILTTAAVFSLAAVAFAAEPAAKGKKVLVFSRCEGFNHKASIATCKAMMSAEAKKGAFSVDFSDDYAALEIGNLIKYDALVLNNTTHLKTKDNPKIAPAICSFVRWGGGLCVIHAGADNFYDAPDCAHLVGGRFDGHPWVSNGTWAFKVEDRESPLTAPFKGFADGKFKRSDEIYQQSSPFYDRSKLHILISLDMDDPATANANVKRQKRADKDYAVSWIRPYGKGRVFYTSFAHDARAWNAEDTRAHIFAGLAYTLGTLKADDTPTGAKCCKERKCCETKKCCPFYLPPLEACAAEVLDTPGAGADAKLRQQNEFRLGAALALAAEKDGAKSVAATARKIFARKDLSAMLRATAARILLAADPAVFSEVVSDSEKKVRQAAFGRGLSIPADQLAKALAGATPERKRAILARFVRDGAKGCAKEVAALTGDPDETVAAAAAAALGTLGSAADADRLNELRKRGGAVRVAAEEALETLPGAGGKIFDLAEKDASLLAIAAKRAESKLLPRWEAALASPEPETRKAAWKAFGKMVSPATEATARSMFLTVKDEEANVAGNVLWQSIIKPLDTQNRPKAILDLWKNGSPAARKQAQDFLYRAQGLDAFDTWEKLAGDAAFGAAAKKAYCDLAQETLKGGAVEKVPPKSQWKGEASRSLGKDVAQRAYDGKLETRWTSGQDSKDVWYKLDLGNRVFIDSVTLDTTRSANDTPAGCDVFVSMNGQDWQGPVATCDDKTVKTTTFQLGRAARHLKFVHTGKRPRFHWSIHEIEVKGGVDTVRTEKIRKTAVSFGMQEGK
ncbi:MAG: ThuA domain-containing protein [Kiritimatiellae bacterium]|nr:ThuA domain-containing protein [Kiritimatiellia bacterium]